MDGPGNAAVEKLSNVVDLAKALYYSIYVGSRQWIKGNVWGLTINDGRRTYSHLHVRILTHHLVRESWVSQLSWSRHSPHSLTILC